ncbi:hypothetical protein [Desulfosporosinus sp. SB140]
MSNFMGRERYEEFHERDDEVTEAEWNNGHWDDSGDEEEEEEEE